MSLNLRNLDQKKLMGLLYDQYEFQEMPPSIDEFLDSPYYLGVGQPGSMWNFVYPFWRERLRELFQNPITVKSTYVLEGGSIGGGKSTFAEIALLYSFCKIACLSNFAKINHINAQKGYFVKVINAAKYKSEKDAAVLNDAVFGGRVPFFQRKLEEGNEFLTRLHIEPCPPEDRSIRSDDVCFFWISEITAMKPDKGLSVISSCLSRLTSRFIETEGVFPLFIIDSSVTSVDSAMDLFERTDPRAKNFWKIHVNAWNTLDGLHRYFNIGSFEMYCGDSSHNPFVVPKDFPLSERSKLDPDRFVICPNELKEEAEGNPILFVQEKCGLSTSSSSKFFTDLKRLGAAFNIEKSYDDMIIVDFFDPSDTIMSRMREAVSQLPTDRRLYIKVDCGLTHDLYGFALGYGDSADLVNVDGIPTERIKIKIPILFGLSRYAGQESSILKIEDFILQINENYDVAKVWYDSYQSAELGQVMKQNGIEAERRYTDRNDSDYIIAKNYIYSGLVDIADNNIAYKEMSELERVSPTKIDRVCDGVSHKDLSDCIAAICGGMVELGPEEVFSAPESKMNDDIIDAYQQLSNYRNNRYASHGYISDYL